MSTCASTGISTGISNICFVYYLLAFYYFLGGHCELYVFMVVLYYSCFLCLFFRFSGLRWGCNFSLGEGLEK